MPSQAELVSGIKARLQAVEDARGKDAKKSKACQLLEYLVQNKPAMIDTLLWSSDYSLKSTVKAKLVELHAEGLDRAPEFYAALFDDSGDDLFGASVSATAPAFSLKDPIFIWGSPAAAPVPAPTLGFGSAAPTFSFGSSAAAPVPAPSLGFGSAAPTLSFASLAAAPVPAPAPAFSFGSAAGAPVIVDSITAVQEAEDAQLAAAIAASLDVSDEVPPTTCIICMNDDHKREVLFTGCGHFCLCLGCSEKLRDKTSSSTEAKCPVCRKTSDMIQLRVV